MSNSDHGNQVRGSHFQLVRISPFLLRKNGFQLAACFAAIWHRTEFHFRSQRIKIARNEALSLRALGEFQVGLGAPLQFQSHSRIASDDLSYAKTMSRANAQSDSQNLYERISLSAQLASFFESKGGPSRDPPPPPRGGLTNSPTTA